MKLWVESSYDLPHKEANSLQPALEFLGAPGNNKEKQAQIQAVFGNVATVIYSYVNPLTHYIHVRCDDIGEKCEKRPDNDPCNPESVQSCTYARMTYANRVIALALFNPAHLKIHRWPTPQTMAEMDIH